MHMYGFIRFVLKRFGWLTVPLYLAQIIRGRVDSRVLHDFLWRQDLFTRSLRLVINRVVDLAVRNDDEMFLVLNNRGFVVAHRMKVSVAENEEPLFQRYVGQFFYFPASDTIMMECHFAQVVFLDFHDNVDVFFVLHVIFFVARRRIGRRIVNCRQRTRTV